MFFRTKKRTCNMQHATLRFLCIYAGNSKNTAWLTMPNKCKGTLTLLSPTTLACQVYDLVVPSL